METRLEYQRMYVANAMQQAQQEKADLENKVNGIKENDASKLKELVYNIREKRKVLNQDMDAIQTLSDEYEEDHKIGESLDSKAGAGTLAHAEARQERNNINTESAVADKAHAMMQMLTHMHANTQEPLVQSANELLGHAHAAPGKKELGESGEITATDTDGIEGAALGESEIELAAKISVAKTALKLKLDKFADMSRQEQNLLSEATHVHQAALNARKGEFDEQTRTAAMQNVVKDLNRSVQRHEESLELGETLFSAESAKKEEMADDDLGESSSVDDQTKDSAKDKAKNKASAGLPPIQAELNYEHEKMAEAEAEIKHLANDGPKIVADQIALDKKKYGTVLKKTEQKLNKLHTRFTHAAARLSPKFRSQQALDEAVRDEESRQGDYAHDLDNIGAYANMVDVKARETEDAARADSDDVAPTPAAELSK